MKARRKIAACLAGVILVAWAGWALTAAPPALAHGDLETATPASNAAVQASPAEIVLTFSETPDPALSLIKLVDSQGRPAGGASAVQGVAGDPLAIRVMLTRALAGGTYSVNWRVVSAEDGHVSTGAYAFGVGATPAPGAVVIVEILHTSRWISLVAAAGRWLLYVGLALLMGAATMCGLVLRGRVPGGGMVVVRWAMVMAVVGLGLSIAAERAAVGAPRLLPLFETREGKLLLAQGAALVLCVVAVVCVDLFPGRRALVALGSVAVLTMLVRVYSGHAHSPADQRVLHIATQWIHMAAVSMWIGGLPWLLLGIRATDRGERSRVAAAFSRVATMTLAVVVATGVLRALAEVGSWAALGESTYGRTLLFKLTLVAGLAGLGALQHFRSVPRVTADGDMTRPLRLTARGELALAAVVLATTAVLSGLAPPGT